MSTRMNNVYLAGKKKRYALPLLDSISVSQNEDTMWSMGDVRPTIHSIG